MNNLEIKDIQLEIIPGKDILGRRRLSYRFTHKPSGIVVGSKNKAEAYEAFKTAVKQYYENKENAK